MFSVVDPGGICWRWFVCTEAWRGWAVPRPAAWVLRSIWLSKQRHIPLFLLCTMFQSTVNTLTPVLQLYSVARVTSCGSEGKLSITKAVSWFCSPWQPLWYSTTTPQLSTDAPINQHNSWPLTDHNGFQVVACYVFVAWIRSGVCLCCVSGVSRL